MDKQIKAEFIRVLAQTIGNKVYLRDLEQLLERVQLNPHEVQALRYLSQDIRHLDQSVKDAQRNKWRP